MKNVVLKILLLTLTGSGFLISCNNSGSETNEELNEEVDEEWTLVWSDEFDAEQLDPQKWSYQFGTGAQFGLNGWGNNELQYYTDREKNVYVDNGMLHIVAREEAFEEMNYTSGRIRTINKGDWKFGRIEVRAKLPEGQGIWPAAWMLPTDEVFGGWPKSGEIDIMELVGHKPETIHGTVHYGYDWPENQSTGTSYKLDNGSFSDDFHLFSIEWEENQIRWFTDDQHFLTVTPSDLEPHHYPFNERFHLILNLAVGGNWPGDPDSTTVFPQTMTVDYVRIYKKTE